MLRLGIVGAGVMGAKFGEVAASIDGVRVTAIVDPQAARAGALAAELGSEAFGSIEELAAAGAADAVYIGVPHNLHLDACVQAARAGLHILVDKPLCNTLDEALQIIEATDAAGVKLMVGFSYHFRAEWIRAREVIASGRLGTPRLVVDTLLEATPVTPAWYWEIPGGGVLQLQSHHCFDRIAWLLDEPFDSVACQTAAEPGFAEDVAMITARSASGVPVSIDIGFGRAYAGAARPSTIIQGDAGHIVIDSDRVLTVESALEGREELRCADDDWLVRELTAFVELCRGSDVAVPGAAEGVAALRCALAAAESAAADGERVRLS